MFHGLFHAEPLLYKAKFMLAEACAWFPEGVFLGSKTAMRNASVDAEALQNRELPLRMKTLPHLAHHVNPPKPEQPYIEQGRLNALEEVERLEMMSDQELVAERLDLIEQTGTTQALCALIVDIQKKRNIAQSQESKAKTIRAVLKLARRWQEAGDGHGAQLWQVIRECEE
jgi:hypothetical protein